MYIKIMDNKSTIDTILNKLTEGLTEILHDSYPLCKHDDKDIASVNAKINNTAFELKRITVLLKNQLDILQ